MTKKVVKNKGLQKGQTNNPNGRPKGVPNKRTQDLIEIAEKLECNPFEILLLFAKGDYEKLGYEKWHYKQIGENVVEELSISPELRQKSAKDACEYLFPKRKAVEHTFKDPKDMPNEELISETAKLMQELSAI
jgi:hypothetical protein